MDNLTQLAAQIESAKEEAAWQAHKVEFAAQEAEQETAAYMAKMERDAELAAASAALEAGLTEDGQRVPHHGQALPPVNAGEEVPEWIETTPDALQRVLVEGGYATVTVRNELTQKHVTLTFVARMRKPDGKGWVSRATALGRVGLEQADCIEARDPDREYPENYVGRWYKGAAGGWKAGREADAVREKTAHVVLAWALVGGNVWASATVLLATSCQVCGRKLTHPESVLGMIGPECKGKKTVGKAAPHVPKAGA